MKVNSMSQSKFVDKMEAFPERNEEIYQTKTQDTNKKMAMATQKRPKFSNKKTCEVQLASLKR
mgnify:CR=1 FL=1